MTAPEQQPAETSAKSKTPWWAYVVVLALIGIVALVVAHPSKHTPTGAEVRDDAVRACEDKFVPDRLKAPATAKFSSVETTGTQGAGYTVTGSVDSQNSFGALVRSPFTCSVRLTGDTWTLDTAAVG